MAIQRSEAIVLRRQDIRETSIILTLYTRSFGKIKGIVRGVRGPRSQYGGGALELFAHDDIVFYDRKRGDVCTISQCDLIDYFNPIRESLEKLSYASYLIELLDSVTALGEKSEETFDLLINSLRLLVGESSPKRVARIFEIKLLYLSGLMPGLDACSVCAGVVSSQETMRFSYTHGGLICKQCAQTERQASPILPGTVKFIEYVLISPFEKASRVKVAAQVGRELETTLRRFLDYHIERRLKSVQFLKEIEG